MGLQYGYDKVTGKWYAKGFMFRREYDTEEEMNADKHDALERYFERLQTFRAVCGAFAELGGRHLA